MLNGNPTPDAAPRPHVVIIGAGFGGLSAAKELANAPLDVTLVDRYNYHLFQPLLYQVATAQLAPSDIAVPKPALPLAASGPKRPRREVNSSVVNLSHARYRAYPFPPPGGMEKSRAKHTNSGSLRVGGGLVAASTRGSCK